MAKTYGARPCDVAFEGERMSAMERQLFDLYVFGVGIEEENRRSRRKG